MRIGITGEKGFIAKNLANSITQFGHEFISFDNSLFAKNNMKYTESGEVCVHRNKTDDWIALFKHHNLDVVVHNAAIVGTDVVALNPEESIDTNILGTKIITNAANECNILISYIGTTVIYDTYKYQETNITEDSVILPRTDYAIQKYAGEMIVRNNAKEWLVLRPLFAYGGIGDMNSLISKSLYGVKNKIKNIDMFLNPEKIKDYMHVEDFCNSVMTAIVSDIRNDHFNISAQSPRSTSEIIKIIENVTGKNLDDIVKWYPETDYLGNHRLSDDKFVSSFSVQNRKSLVEGITESWDSIKNSHSDFNPLKHLQEAKLREVDLTNFFPTN